MNHRESRSALLFDLAFPLVPYSCARYEAPLLRFNAFLPHEVGGAEETPVVFDAAVRGEFAPDFVTQAQARFDVVQASTDSEPLNSLRRDVGFKACLKNPSLRQQKISGERQAPRHIALLTDEH